MASNVLPLFWQLSSNDTKSRLDASEELVTALHTFQKQHEAKQSTSAGDELMEASEDEDEKDDGDEEDDESGVEVDEDDDMDGKPKRTREMDEEDAEIAKLDRIFETRNSEDVRYSIKRLIRGLASSRENSRFGFAVVLTEVSYNDPALLAREPGLLISLVESASATGYHRHRLTEACDFPHPSRVSDIKCDEGHGGAGQPLCSAIRSDGCSGIRHTLPIEGDDAGLQAMYRRVDGSWREKVLDPRVSMVDRPNWSQKLAAQ